MDKKEAEILLNKSRDRIDVLDKQILDLIIERTSLAYDIASSKKALNKALFDSAREEIIHERLNNLIADVEINKEIVLEIFDLLATLSKEEQNKYLN